MSTSKLCIDCKWFVPHDNEKRLDLSECSHPRVRKEKRSTDIVTGAEKVTVEGTAYCCNARAKWGPWFFFLTTCGPRGRYFESRERPQAEAA